MNTRGLPGIRPREVLQEPGMLQRLRADPRILARWAPSILLGLILCAGPLWLWGGPLRSFFLKSDDFVYVARSRTPAALRAYLLRPHNGHVVPLFRLETHALARVAGSLEALPTVLSWASYATLVLAIAATGHVVARESGRTSLGLAAMAAVGLTSVLGPTLLWYSAGQALATGTMVLAMLAALQAWRIGGAWWALALGLLAAMAAPLLWSGGYAAGPVGMAYLWADGRARLPTRGGGPRGDVCAHGRARLVRRGAGVRRGLARRVAAPGGRAAGVGHGRPHGPGDLRGPRSSTTSASTRRPRAARPSSSAPCSPPSGGGRADAPRRPALGAGRVPIHWRPPAPPW